jgi:hypothetical protein
VVQWVVVFYHIWGVGVGVSRDRLLARKPVVSCGLSWSSLLTSYDIRTVALLYTTLAFFKFFPVFNRTDLLRSWRRISVTVDIGWLNKWRLYPDFPFLSYWSNWLGAVRPLSLFLEREVIFLFTTEWKLALGINQSPVHWAQCCVCVCVCVCV